MMQPLRCDRNWENQEWIIAIHEAGHCVGHLAIGEHIISATIIPDADSLGRVVPLRKAGASYGEISAITFLCGSIAVDLALGSHWVPRSIAANPDWASGRLFLHPRSAERSRPSAEEQARIDALIASAGAENLAVAIDLVWTEGHPDEAQAVDKRLIQLARAAEALLRRRWPAVLRVADALMERKTLTGGEVAAIVKGLA
jgi:hypothetical protein